METAYDQRDVHLNKFDQDYREFFLRYRAEFENELDKSGITPATHQTAAELFAGNGPVTHILGERLWIPNNMLRVDIARTPTPLDPISTPWLYINLQTLAHKIHAGNIPNEVLPYQHAFDIVTATFPITEKGPLPYAVVKTVTAFFAKPSAWTYIYGGKEVAKHQKIDH